MSTGEINKLKDEGFETLRELIENTEFNNKATMNIQDVIHSTSQSAEKIENAINMMRTITEQTNLLALNTVIEAARISRRSKRYFNRYDFINGI